MIVALSVTSLFSSRSISVQAELNLESMKISNQFSASITHDCSFSSIAISVDGQPFGIGLKF